MSRFSGRSASMAQSILSMSLNNFQIGKYIIIMSSLGKSASMAQSIISSCRRTWAQERRIGVLLRALEPPLSVWDCVPETIIDTHLKDAFQYHDDQRDYLLYYAIPGSAVLRSIRRLDGYRASPLILKSLHFFDHQKDIDAYNFPPESDFTDDFSDSEYGENSFISREWTPSPTPISELDDSDIHTTTQTYLSQSKDEAELKDELVRRKPQQWTEYPDESEACEVCIASLQQTALDVDDEASGPEPRLLPPAYQPYTESDGDLKDDEPLETSSFESRLPSPVHQSSPDSDGDLKDYELEPPEASSSESRLPSPIHPFYIDSDDGLKDDEPIEANNPETQTFSPVHQSFPESDDDLKDDEALEANNPEPRPFSGVHQLCPATKPKKLRLFASRVPVYDEEGKLLTEESFEPRPRLGYYPFLPVFDDSDEEDEPPTAENQTFSPVHQSFPESDDDLKDDEAFEATSSQQRILSPVHLPYTESNDDLKDDEPLKANNSEPPLFSQVQYSAESDDDLKESRPFVANSPEPRPFSGVHQFSPVFDNDEEDEPLSAVRPEPRQLHPACQFFSEWDYHQRDNESPEWDYHQRDNESPELDSSKLQRVFSEHQLHSTVYDPQAPQMEILCPQPIRDHAMHKVILEPELFEDWFVDMSEIIFIDEEAPSPEESILGTPYSEPQTPSPEPDFGGQASIGAHGPKPQRIAPVHRSHPRFYGPTWQVGLELDHEGPESLENLSLYY